MNAKWLMLMLGCLVFAACDSSKTDTASSKTTDSERKVLPAVGLTVGLTAPEIQGLDMDGAEFKLSDYRGKVVMLDFWGDW